MVNRYRVIPLPSTRKEPNEAVCPTIRVAGPETAGPDCMEAVVGVPPPVFGMFGTGVVVGVAEDAHAATIRVRTTSMGNRIFLVIPFLQFGRLLFWPPNSYYFYHLYIIKL